MVKELKNIDERPCYGLTWSALGTSLTPAEEIIPPYRPPHIAGDVMAAEYNHDGSVIFITDMQRPCRVFAVTRDYKIKWLKERIDGRGLDYSPLKNTLLVYQTDRFSGQKPQIIEFDAKTGKVLQKLASTELGPVGKPDVLTTGNSHVHYHPIDHNKFWVADNEHHTVYCTDFKGKVHHQYGKYGKPGEANIHHQYDEYNRPGDANPLLRNPVSVSPSMVHTEEERGGGILISDWGNHRIINFSLKKPDTAHHILPFPYPGACYVNDTNCVAVFNCGSANQWYGTFFLGDSNTPVPRFHIPINTNIVVSHPEIPFRFLLAWDCSLYEIDYRDRIYQETPLAPPIQSRLFANSRVSKSKLIYSPPVVDWFRPNKTFIVEPTVDGKLYIETARFLAPHSTWDGSWAPIEVITLKENRANSVFLPQPLGICRIGIKLSSKGNVDGWVNLSP